MPELSVTERQRLHGKGFLEAPQPIVAGEHSTLTFHFEAGACPIPTGGRLRIVWLWPYDWADLQVEDPGGDGYMSVSTSGNPAAAQAVVQARYRRRGDLIPWNHEIELTLVDGQLQQGDRLQLVCGDRSGGGAGWRAPTFAAPAAEILLLTNPDGGDKWIQLAAPPRFPIVARPAVRLVALAPSTGLVGHNLEVVVRAEDEWGNATALDQDALRLEGAQNEGTAAMVSPAQISAEPPAYRFSVRFDRVGTHRLKAAVSGTSLHAESNPVRIDAARPPLQVFWGDLHSGQGEIGCGVGSVAQHFTYCRDVSALQFTTHQGNDHHITLPMWEEVRRTTEAYNEPGRFVTFLGCEWSALTEEGGDRNIVYRGDEPRLRRSGRFFTEGEPDPEPDLTTAPQIHRALRDETVLINLHAGGRTTNLDFHEPRIEPLAEIHSTHGTSEWFVFDALERGYKVGVTGGTDGVAGRPGADHPGSRLIRNVRSGFTAVYARELTREGIWEALQARRCYATSGERILLEFEVDGQPMGAECTATGEPLVEIKAEGTAPIEQVDLLCGTQVLCSWQMGATGENKNALRLLWGGTEKRGTAPDQRVVWDGELQLTDGRFLNAAPIGFQSPCDSIRLDSPQTLRWRSTTAGNRAGLQFEFAAAETARFDFSAGPCTFAFQPHQVALKPMVIDAGGVSRRVEIGPAPETGGGRTVELAYRDTRPLRGLCPYWVRVVQVDQARAWSSPVYVTRRP